MPEILMVKIMGSWMPGRVHEVRACYRWHAFACYLLATYMI